MLVTNNTSPIAGRVCKHATYSEHKFDRTKDLTSVKITNVHEDGTRSSELMLIENYKQPVYIVKPKLRKFKQYKDYIKEGACKKYMVPRRQIGNFVSRTLFGKNDTRATIRDAKTTPYVFNIDQTPPVIIKHAFFKKYGDYQNKELYNVAAYDVETNMNSDENEVIMASVTSGPRIFFAVVRSWFNGLSDKEILKGLKEAEDKHLGDIIREKKATVVYEIVNTPGEVVKRNVEMFHEFDVDYVASWNATYDMEKNEEMLLKEGMDIEAIYNDPSIPREYRSYRLDRGRTHKVKEDGTSSPLEPQEKFPSVRCHARWQWVDFMSVYAIKRFHAGKLESYALQDIAESEKVRGKLYTEEGSQFGEGSPQWHRHMQTNHPFIYCMYNIADNFVIEEINDATKDLSLTLPMLLRYSEYFNFVSQPRIISDTLSFIAKENGYVWGSAPAVRDKSFNEILPGLGGWIALLDSEKMADKGVVLFKGLYDVISRGRRANNDIDVTGAYPHVTVGVNVSNRTTQMEVCRIEGLDDLELREIGVNLASSPQANAVGLSNLLFGFPHFSHMEQVLLDKLKENNELHLLEELLQAA